MLYALDRIENNIAILENLETKDQIEIPLVNLPNEVKEGSILKKVQDKFILNLSVETKRRIELRNRLEKLKKLNSGDANE